MFKCPQCRAPLSADAVSAGVCPACRATVGGACESADPAAGAGDAGVSSSEIAATIDSVHLGSLPVASFASGESDPAQTVESHDSIDLQESMHPSAPATVHTVEFKDLAGLDSDGALGAADRSAETIDSSVIFDSGEAGSQPGGSENILATIASAELPIDVAERMSKVWGKAQTAGAPGMTIKSIVFEGEAGESSLIVQQRAISRPVDGTAPSADYDLLDVIGEGGVGVVYAARQASIDRQVAVKMLKPDATGNASQQRKFLSEAVVTGELEHPGIIPIYDLGCNRDGTLFYSMKRVQGTPWSKVIRQKSLSENLEILLRVCDAIAFAHAKGVVHRDLKPENIMLGDFGEVLVLDWGLALSLNDDPKASLINRIATLGGTPAYMAPEMATGPLEAIGVRSDVYLMGAILYEIVTGHMPHRGKTATACLMAAVKNSILPTEKKGDLVDIALRAMATRPEDRYADVREFQRAIRDCQSHFESIALVERAEEELRKARASDDYQDYARSLFGYEEAHELWDKNQRAAAGISECRLAYATCAYTKGDYDLGLSLLGEADPQHAALRDQMVAAQRERDARQQRLRRAKRMMLALAGLVFVSVTAGIVLVSIQKAEADRQRRIAEENEGLARREKAEADRQRGLAEENEGLARREKAEADRQRGLAEANEGLARREKAEAVNQRGKAEYQAYVALIGLAAARLDENAFGPALELLNECKPDLRNWEWGRLRHLCQQEIKRFDAADRVECVAFDARGEHVAAAARDGWVRVWETTTGKIAAEYDLNATGGNSLATAVACSPAAPDWLAIGSSDPRGVLRLWNAQTGETRVLDGHRDTVVSVVFSRDGQRLLSASMDNLAILWDVAGGQIRQTFRGHDWWVWDAAFSPDESQVVTASQDGTVRLWEVTTGSEQLSDAGEPMPFTGHRGAVFTARFAPDGRSVASAGHDQRVLLWKPSELRPFDYSRLLRGEPIATQPSVALEGHKAAVRRVEFSPDGQWLLSASHDNSIKLWSARDGEIEGQFVTQGTLLKTLRGHSSLVRSAAFSPVDGNLVASGGYDHNVRLWSIRDYAEERLIPGTLIRGHADAVLAASFSPTGDSVVTASRDRTAKTWKTASGQELQSFREGHLYLASRGVFFPDGQQIATAAIDGSVSVWNISTGAQVLKLEGTGAAAVLALSADGRWLVTGRDVSDAVTLDRQGGEPLSWTIWDATSGQVVRSLGGHTAEVTTAAFSADGRWIFTGDSKGRGNLWDAASGELRHTLRWHTDRITGARFLPGQQELITASADRTVCRWSLATGDAPRPVEELVLKHPDSVTALALTRDGRRLITGCEDGRVRCWELESAAELWQRALAAGGIVRSVDLSADDRLLAVVDSANNAVHLWELDRPSDGAETTLELDQEDAVAWSAVFAPDARSLLTIGGNEARIWDLQGVELMNFRPHRTVSFASYSPDGGRIITAGWDHSARIWNAATGQPLRKLAGAAAGPEGGHTDSVNSAMFSPDGTSALTASDDGTLKIWDVESGVVRMTLRGHTASVQHAAYSRDGRWIVSSSRDKTARVWDVASGQQLQVLSGHELAVMHAAFSYDGTRVATAGEDTTVKIWDTVSGREIRTLTGHTASVLAVTFAPDGMRLLSGCGDHTAKLWDAQQGTEILTLKGHQQEVTSVVFSEDGRTVLTASRDGTAILWPAAAW